MILLIKINDGAGYEDGDIIEALPNNWTFSEVEYKHFLILNVPDTDAPLAAPLLSGTDEEGYEVDKLRRYYVKWTELDGIDVDDVRDGDTSVDVTATEYPLSVINDKGE
jgi:hypothetical protein